MEAVDFKTSSRRRPQGGDCFDAKKPRHGDGALKPAVGLQFRLIALDRRDTRATMISLRKRRDCIGLASVRAAASSHGRV
jgi:hypothetical protein